MKKWIIFLISIVTASSFCAAENQIQKVTYFPLPYAAYHNINATTLDIGVGRVSPEVSLGQSGVSAVPLSASNTTVTQGLKLDGKTAGKNGIIREDSSALQVTLAGETNSDADVSFGRNLRVNALTNADSVSAQQMKLKGLKLFGKDFPECAGQEMHWVRLNLKDNSVCSWYLMCGSLDSVSGYECTLGESSETSGKKTCQEWVDARKTCEGYCTKIKTSLPSMPITESAFQNKCCESAEKTVYGWQKIDTCTGALSYMSNCLEPALEKPGIKGKLDFVESDIVKQYCGKSCEDGNMSTQPIKWDSICYKCVSKTVCE